MKKKYSSKLNQIENKLNYKESDDFVRHIYYLLAIQDLSDQELDELIELGNRDLEALSLKHDELIKTKMNEVKFGEIDQDFIGKEKYLNKKERRNLK